MYHRLAVKLFPLIERFGLVDYLTVAQQVFNSVDGPLLAEHVLLLFDHQTSLKVD